MSSWEYTITSIVDEGYSLAHLNTFGKVGWELVFMYRDDFNHVKFVFKRPITTEEGK
jgi:hypothetical protein